MTSLQLTDAETPALKSLWAAIPWKLVVPWMITAIMFGNSIYYRLITVETVSQQDRRVMARVEEDVRALQRQVGILQAILERMERDLQRQGGKP